MGAFIAFMVAIGFGFWMGRMTVGKPLNLPIPKTGGQSLFEEDPYADAMRRDKSEGSL